MSGISGETGYAFVGHENLHNDIYPAIAAQQTSSLHQPGKVVLITGAGRGIGRAIAIQYAYANVASIILCARTASQLDEVASAIKTINSDIRVNKYPIDVTSETAVAALAEDIAKKEDRLDILVNNAGYSARWTPIHLSEPSDWWRSFEVNLKGPYLFARAFLPLLLKTAEKTGHVDVVNVASIGAHQVNAVASNYTMSKLAVCRLTENIDVGYKDKGVIAVSVNPGGVETELASQEIDILKPCKLSRYLLDLTDSSGADMSW
jgi:NAD(P)-dependent dehydrogenase (short-subunit alcohol dehydrogenase family)